MSRKSPPPTTQVRNPPQAGKIESGESCGATTCKGQPCKSRAMTGSRFCFFHNPKSKANRKAAQSKGGKNALARQQPEPLDLPDVSLKSAQDVLDLMSDTISKLRRRKMERATCSTIGYLSQVVLKSIEQGETEDRLAKIEEHIDKESEGK